MSETTTASRTTTVRIAHADAKRLRRIQQDLNIDHAAIQSAMINLWETSPKEARQAALTKALVPALGGRR